MHDGIFTQPTSNNYVIWGDTVNLASRLEHQSEPGKINISEATWSLIKDHFNCNFRGKIAVKSKGELDMYFVGRKTNLQLATGRSKS